MQEKQALQHRSRYWYNGGRMADFLKNNNFLSLHIHLIPFFMMAAAAPTASSAAAAGSTVATSASSTSTP